MRDSRTAKWIRIAAGIIGLVMLFAWMFSAFYVVSEKDHDCSGEDCSICSMIRQCEIILNQIGGWIVVQRLAVVRMLFLALSTLLFAYEWPRETLVSQKVRLNN